MTGLQVLLAALALALTGAALGLALARPRRAYDYVFYGAIPMAAPIAMVVLVYTGFMAGHPASLNSVGGYTWVCAVDRMELYLLPVYERYVAAMSFIAYLFLVIGYLLKYEGGRPLASAFILAVPYAASLALTYTVLPRPDLSRILIVDLNHGVILGNFKVINGSVCLPALSPDPLHAAALAALFVVAVLVAAHAVAPLARNKRVNSQQDYIPTGESE